MDKPEPPTSSLSRSIMRRIGLLSILISIGAIFVIILGLLLTLNRVNATMSEIKIEAASASDLFFLNIQSDLLATSDGLAEHNDKNSALLALRIRNNVFLDVLFISPDGDILAQRNAVGRPTRTDIEESAWLMSPPPFGEVVVGPVRFEGQTPYVDMAVTATDAIGLPSGILFVRVDLTQLWNKTLDIQVGNTGYAYIVDDSGQLVAFRNRRLLESGSNLQNLVGHTPQEIAASAFNFYTSMNNQPVLATAQPLKTVPWFTVVEQPIYEALAPFVPVGMVVFFVIAIVVFSIRNTLQFTRNRIVSPLSSLREAVRQMEDGQLGARVTISRNDELGQLGYAFNLMAGEIQSQTESLIENEAKLSAIFNNSRDAISLSKEEFHILVNPAYARMFGYEKPEELIGVPIPDLITPESRPTILENIQKRARGEDAPTFYETTAMRRDGTEFLMEVNVSAYEFKDEIYTVAILRDITERKRAEETLREHQQMVSAIVENSHDWIWTLDITGHHTYSNAATEEILGYTPAELQGMGLDLLHPEDRRVVDAQWPEWVEARQGWSNLVLRWRNKDGNYRYLESTAVPILGPQGELLGYRGVDRDITERKQAEMQLQEQLDELRRWHQVTVGREDRIIALKREVNDLLEQDGKPPRYLSTDME